MDAGFKEANNRMDAGFEEMRTGFKEARDHTDEKSAESNNAIKELGAEMRAGFEKMRDHIDKRSQEARDRTDKLIKWGFGVMGILIAIVSLI